MKSRSDHKFIPSVYREVIMPTRSNETHEYALEFMGWLRQTPEGTRVVKSILLAELNLEIPFIQEILLGVDPAVLTTSLDKERLEHFARVLSKAGAIVEVTQRGSEEEPDARSDAPDSLLDLDDEDPFSVEISLEERMPTRQPPEPTKVWDLSMDDSDSVDAVLESFHDNSEAQKLDEAPGPTADDLLAPAQATARDAEAPASQQSLATGEPFVSAPQPEPTSQQAPSASLPATLETDDLDLSLGLEPVFEQPPEKKFSLDDFDDDLKLDPLTGTGQGHEPPSNLLGFEDTAAEAPPPSLVSKGPVTVPPQAAPSKVLQPSAPLLDLGLDEEPEPHVPPVPAGKRQEAPEQSAHPPAEPSGALQATPPAAIASPSAPVNVPVPPVSATPPVTESPDERLKSLAISINNLSLNGAEEAHQGMGATGAHSSAQGTPQEIILAPSADAPRWSAFFQSSLFQVGRGGRRSAAQEYGIPLAIGVVAICVGNALFFSFLAPERPATPAAPLNPQALLGTMEAPATTAIPNATATPLPAPTGKLRLEKSDGLGTFSVQCDQFGEHLMRCSISGGMKEPPLLTPEEIVKQKTPPLWIRHYESDPFFLHHEDDGSLKGSTTSRLVVEQDGQRGRTSATAVAELKRVKESLRLYVRLATSPISSASSGDPNAEESSIGGTIRAPEITYRRWVITE